MAFISLQLATQEDLLPLTATIKLAAPTANNTAVWLGVRIGLGSGYARCFVV